MAFTSRAFRRNRATEMVLELQASLADEQRLDRSCDGEVGRIDRHAGALRDWLAARVPALSRVFVFIGGLFDGLGGYRAADALRDHENTKQLAIARELAGMLDHVDEDTPATVIA